MLPAENVRARLLSRVKPVIIRQELTLQNLALNPVQQQRQEDQAHLAHWRVIPLMYQMHYLES